VAGTQQVRGHRQAHRAESDEADAHGGSPIPIP
jgi:hypothetical protein